VSTSGEHKRHRDIGQAPRNRFHAELRRLLVTIHTDGPEVARSMGIAMPGPTTAAHVVPYELR